MALLLRLNLSTMNRLQRTQRNRILTCSRTSTKTIIITGNTNIHIKHMLRLTNNLRRTLTDLKTSKLTQHIISRMKSNHQHSANLPYSILRDNPLTRFTSVTAR